MRPPVLRGRGGFGSVGRRDGYLYPAPFDVRRSWHRGPRPDHAHQARRGHGRTLALPAHRHAWGPQTVQALHLETVPPWLAGLEPSRVKEVVRPGLRLFKRWIRTTSMATSPTIENCWPPGVWRSSRTGSTPWHAGPGAAHVGGGRRDRGRPSCRCGLPTMSSCTHMLARERGSSTRTDTNCCSRRCSGAPGRGIERKGSCASYAQRGRHDSE